MYEFSPVSDRIARIRDKYRNTLPTHSSERTRLITEYYQTHEAEPAILKRARCLYNTLEKMTIWIGEDDLIVGNTAPAFRGVSINPEYNGLMWLTDELRSGRFFERDEMEEKSYMPEEDIAYYYSAESYWEDHCVGARGDITAPDVFWEKIQKSGVLPTWAKYVSSGPIGHFSTNYGKAIDKGFQAIKEEAKAKMDEMEGRLMSGDAEKYTFYRAIIVICDAAMMFAKRYAKLARTMSETQTGARKEELLMMADGLDNVLENPARSFYEAVQGVYLYQLMMCIDGQMHGISFGRFDQYTGHYYEKDLREGRITPAYGQEIVDSFVLKVSEAVKAKTLGQAINSGGYTSGQHTSLGGVKRDGSDATNPVSYMMLEGMARLFLHDPPLSLRVHDETPAKLWEAAIECTKRVGGIPTLQSDKIIIPALMDRGLTLEDARDYCIIGCVEPAGAGTEFPCCGGTGYETYINQANILVAAINNGVNPLTGNDCGLHLGYLYDMKSFEEVKAAFEKYTDYFVHWHFTMTNLGFMNIRQLLPLPSVSATMDGCMEKGMDVINGGAKYNSMGSSGVGCANVADSLAVIKYAVFDKKICTARELYDAIITDWEGQEVFRQRIRSEVPRYGNDDPYVDALAHWSMDVFADAFKRCTCDRDACIGQAGMYPVSTNVVHGKNTWATPDGRKAHEPLADGISPMQGLDKHGPAAVLKSVSKIDHRNFANGTLLNMKFHPKAVEGPDGNQKLKHLVETFFGLGGMHLQYNVIGSDTLREAQHKPEDYQDLVIRIAGFSAYFVELSKDLQDDLISRTDLAV
jgi:formate C-acetyltransferase